MHTQIQFGPFRLDPRTGELFKSGRRIRVQQHPLTLLQLLLDHPGEVVTRDEIRDRLWPNGVVVDFEHSINSAVNKLRAALADTAENPTYVETVARKGYRFLPPIERVAVPGEGRARPVVSTGPAMLEPQRQASNIPQPFRLSGRRFRVAAMALAGGLAMAGGGYVWKTKTDRDWAAASAGQVEQLAAAGRYPEGYSLALRILQFLPAE